MISRAARRTNCERPSSASLRPAISAFSFSRVRSDAGILSIGVLLRRGRSPNRTSLVSPIRRGCTPTLFPASLGLHPEDREVGRVVMPNITPDPETGIGKWSDAEIVVALRDGKRPDGSIIGPPMPILMYRQLSDLDAAAIAAYLRSLKPVKNALARSQYKSHCRATVRRSHTSMSR